MNLIAASVCLPLFSIVFLIDCYFFSFSRKNIPRWQKAICSGCIISSFFQFTSLIFWVIGFVKDPTGYTGEACGYLVVAEIMLILYQWIFTVTTFYLLLNMVNVYLNLQKMSNKFPPQMWGVFAVVFAFTLSWVFVQSFTPYNKRCAGEEKVLYHLYQPTTIVWCVIDVASSVGVVGIFFLMNKKLTKHVDDLSSMGVQTSDVSRSSHNGSGSPSHNTSQKEGSSPEPLQQHQKVMRKHMRFALKQACVSIVSMVIASVIYDLQFNKGSVNGDLVCVFCVLLYLGYGFRRVPMLWHFSGYRALKAAHQNPGSTGSKTKHSQTAPVSNVRPEADIL